MPEIKIFVDVSEKATKTVVICPSNAEKLGVSNGGMVEVFNPDNGQKVAALVEISDLVLDFAGQVSKDIVKDLQFAGVELVIRPSTVQLKSTSQPAVSSFATKVQPQVTSPQYTQEPAPMPTPRYQPTPTPTPSPTYHPSPAPMPMPTPQPSLTPLPKNPKTMAIPAPMSMPAPMSSLTPQPGIGPISPTIKPSVISPTPTTQQVALGVAAPSEPYPNKIDVHQLQSQKSGLIMTPVVDPTIQGGRVQLSVNVVQNLRLAQSMLIAWEDPLTRAAGSARIDVANIPDSEIHMSPDTKDDTNIKAAQIVVYSTEPPIQKLSQIMLEVRSQPNLSGFCQISPRVQYSLSLQNNDVIAFEDELTGAMGACKVQVSEAIADKAITIDSEILEASGIGSYEVKVSKNQRQIIPLQSISLGISPISGENMWQIVSNARQNVSSLKGWLTNYVIFKGIKLRWAAANVACSIVSCVPDLSGDVLAEITPNTTVTLAPTGLIPFNAILIIDISRSMMARDVLSTNIAPAIEGIKAAMESREIQDFLKNFKEGVNVPRRVAAAFAAVLFLSEKVGRGFGEKVSIIRFADEAQLLTFGDTFYMDSASGKKGILEEAARMIVDRIGNSYGQATMMADALLKAYEVLIEYERISPNQPTMVVLLTDGVPTDVNNFFEAVKRFSENPNVVIYIIGLGNPDDDMMTRAASLCGGEYFKPKDAGELLIWYSKRARDLTVRLKSHQKQ